MASYQKYCRTTRKNQKKMSQRNSECHILYQQERLSMAHTAFRLCPSANSLLLFPQVETRRSVGKDPQCSPLHGKEIGRQAGKSQPRNYRFQKRQDITLIQTERWMETKKYYFCILYKHLHNPNKLIYFFTLSLYSNGDIPVILRKKRHM